MALKKVTKTAPKTEEDDVLGFEVPQKDAQVLARETPASAGGAGSGPSVVEHVALAPCSIEFARDAKGATRWTLKLYAERGDMLKVVEEITSIDAALKEKTRTSGNNNGDGDA